MKKSSSNTLTIHKDSKKIIRESRELPRVCRFCVSAHSLYYGETMLCDRKGVVSCEYSCTKFCYDPLKHQPVQTPDIIPFDEALLAIDDIGECCGHPVLNKELTPDFSEENAVDEATHDRKLSCDTHDTEDGGLPELVFTSHCPKKRKEAAVL